MKPAHSSSSFIDIAVTVRRVTQKGGYWSITAEPVNQMLLKKVWFPRSRDAQADDELREGQTVWVKGVANVQATYTAYKRGGMSRPKDVTAFMRGSVEVRREAWTDE